MKCSNNREDQRKERLERAIQLRRESGLVRGELLTVMEAVIYTRYEKDTIYNLVNTGRLRAFKPQDTGQKGPQLIDSADIDDYFRKLETVPSAGTRRRK